jgi:hypothetical protein
MTAMNSLPAKDAVHNDYRNTAGAITDRFAATGAVDGAIVRGDPVRGEGGAEMREFYAAAPLPAWLESPKQVRVRRSATVLRTQRWAEAHPTARRDERSEMIVPNRRLPAREQAEDAMRRSEASGNPIDLRKFSAEAYGWWAHPPRDGKCPPPKIGYARRRPRPPKDYRPPWD